MDRLIEGGSAADDDHDDVRSREHTDDFDLKEKYIPNEEDSHGGFERYDSGSIPTPSYRSTSKGSAVGPKGVIADYNEAKQKMYIKHEIQHAELERIAYKNSFTVLSNREEEILAAREQEVNRNLEELIDDEDEFFKQYRELRMQQWQQQQVKRYGELIHITREEFLDEIDEEPKSTFIVVHLYENYYEACERTNDCLRILAQKYPKVKFLKAISTDLKPNWDSFALPSLLIYKGGGDYVKSFIRITEEIGERFTWKDIAELLASDGIIELEDN